MLDWLAEKGYDIAYGARPLKRVIQKEIQNSVAKLIIAGDLKENQNVVISIEMGGIVVKVS